MNSVTGDDLPGIILIATIIVWLLAIAGSNGTDRTE